MAAEVNLTHPNPPPMSPKTKVKTLNGLMLQFAALNQELEALNTALKQHNSSDCPDAQRYSLRSKQIAEETNKLMNQIELILGPTAAKQE